MASDVDSSPHSAARGSEPALDRDSSSSSSGVRAAVRSFARDGARVVVLIGDTNRQRFVVHAGAPAQRFRLGTSTECNWTVDAPGVAPLHLELHWDGGDVFVTPLAGSSVLLNGATHRHRFRITGDTRVQLGDAVLAIWVGSEPRPEEQPSPSRPPQAFHVARPPRMVEDISKTRTAMGMVSPLLAAYQAQQDAARGEPLPAPEPARPARRTEPFYVGGLVQVEEAARRVAPSVAAPVVHVAGARSLFDTSEAWPEPPLSASEHDGARLLVPAAELLRAPTPAPPSASPPTTVELRLPPLPPAPVVVPQAAPVAPEVPARAQALSARDEELESALAGVPALPAPPPAVRALSIREDTRGTTPAMRVLTSELTVVDPGTRVLTPPTSLPVATPRPAPREGPLPAAELAAPPTSPFLPVAPVACPPALAPTRSSSIDAPWPGAPVPSRHGVPPIQSQAQARWLDPLPAPQPGRPLLATSAALRERYVRDREAEWETPTAGALERPRVSVLGVPKAERGHTRQLYWLGILGTLLVMGAAPLAIPELREDARELLRRGLRGMSTLLGDEARPLDRMLPPRPPRAPELGEPSR